MQRFRALIALILTALGTASTAVAGTSITFNGAAYTVPSVADANWGQNVSNYLTAIASGTLQKTGGSFTLTNEANFGSTYGLVAQYVKSQTAPVAGTGVLRLGNGDGVTWRNAGNSADLALTVNGSNQLTFGGTPLVGAASGSPYQVLTVPSGGGAGTYGAVALGQSAAVTGTLAVANGGTGLSAGTSGGVLAFTASGTLTSSNALPANGVLYGGGSGFTPGATAAGSSGQVLLATTGAAPSWGAVNLASGAAVTGTLAPANGGTGSANTGTLAWGSSNLTFATSGATSLTLPTTGTLATLGSSETFLNKTINGANNTLTVRLASDVTGTLPIGSGGTGQTSKTAAYNALTPLTTKGDLVGFDGTNGVRVAVGSDGTVLSADSTQAAGLKWISPLTNPMSSAQDIIVGGSGGAANRLPTSLLGTVQASVSSQTATITVATPGVLTVAAAPATGAAVYLTTTGALPTGLTASTTYYAINTSSTTLKLATSLGNALAGTAIATSGTQSGTHTLSSGGLIVGSNGLPGNITGTAVGSGYVGEYLENHTTSTGLASSGSYAQVATKLLHPGIYLLFGHAAMNLASITGLTSLQAAISTTSGSGTAVGTNDEGFNSIWLSGTTTNPRINVGPVYLNVSSDTTYYLNVAANFSGGTGMTWTSCILYAVRVD